MKESERRILRRPGTGCYQSAVRAVVQRVSRAEVRVGDEVTGRIGPGLCVLLGAGDEDTDDDLGYLVDKVVGLRIFADDEGNMNRSVVDVGGSLLVVSQFTLYGDARKGRRPSFVKAMAPGPAEQMYERFVAAARATGVPVETGRFRAMMQVELVNDGPVTLLLDSKRQF
jgi:D-aminoacyl-tRNA deacylase